MLVADEILGIEVTDKVRAQLNATIVGRTDVTKDLVRLWVRPDAPYKPFLPGQYVALGLPAIYPRLSEPAGQSENKLIKRTYSIASGGTETEVLEFYLTVVPEGELTPRIAPLTEGARMHAGQKIAGTFTLEGIGESCHLVFVATGTGIAPFMSMLRTNSTWIGQRRITLIHGVRHCEELGYADELSSMERSHPFRFIPIVTRPHSQWLGLKGRVQHVLFDSSFELRPECEHVFLCGNPAMVDDVEQALLGFGFALHSKRNPGNIHVEKYW